MIIYNGLNSELNFDLHVASKDIPPPTRKEITETVPHMSGEWDFSYNENGEDEYEPVTLKYEFDVIADTKQELNVTKKKLLLWLYSNVDKRLYDSDISLSEYWEVYRVRASWSEEWLQGLLTVEFVCYPFRKTETQKIHVTLSETEQSITVYNGGYRAIMPVIEVAEAANLNFENKTYALGAGTYNGGVITLKRGSNVIKVKGSGELTLGTWEEAL